MEFVEHNAESLKLLIESQQFKTWNDIPISYHRALSHLANPNLKEGDVLLITITENKELVGYLGFLPDNFVSDNQKNHVAWVTCFWVKPALRGKNIATQLIQRAKKTWGGCLIISGMVPQTEKIYLNSGLFDKAYSFEGIKVFTGFDLSNWLPPKHILFRKLVGVLKMADLVLSVLNKASFKLKNNKVSENQISIAVFDDTLQSFLDHQAKNYCTQKGFKAWKWLMENPWVLENRRAEHRYYFTAVAKRFLNIAYQIKNGEGKIIAFLMLTINNKTLKVPALYGYDQAENEITQLIVQSIKKHHVASFISYQPQLVNAINHGKLKGFYKKAQKRKIFIGTAIDYHNFNASQFQDGDGDLGFT